MKDIINFEKAEMLYLVHGDYIRNLIKSINESITSNETKYMSNPGLWKPEHWRWYVLEYRFEQLKKVLK